LIIYFLKSFPLVLSQHIILQVGVGAALVDLLPHTQEWVVGVAPHRSFETLPERITALMHHSIKALR
jgi:hypothetical protein